MNSTSSGLSAATSARSSFWTASGSLASICRTELGGADRREMLERLAQHLEQDGGRPTEHQDAVHRGHWPGELPSLHGRDIAVTERGVVDEGEIEQIAAGSRGTDDRADSHPAHGS